MDFWGQLVPCIIYVSSEISDIFSDLRNRILFWQLSYVYAAHMPCVYILYNSVEILSSELLG